MNEVKSVSEEAEENSRSKGSQIEVEEETARSINRKLIWLMMSTLNFHNKGSMSGQGSYGRYSNQEKYSRYSYSNREKNQSSYWPGHSAQRPINKVSDFSLQSEQAAGKPDTGKSSSFKSKFTHYDQEEDYHSNNRYQGRNY